MGSVCLLSCLPRRFRGTKTVSAQLEILFISTNDCGVAEGSYKHSEHTTSLTYSCDGKVGQCMTALVMSKTRTCSAEGVFAGFWSLGSPDLFFFQTKPRRGGPLSLADWCWDQMFAAARGCKSHPLHYITGHMVPLFEPTLTDPPPPKKSLSLYVLITFGFRLFFFSQ